MHGDSLNKFQFRFYRKILKCFYELSKGQYQLSMFDSNGGNLLYGVHGALGIVRRWGQDLERICSIRLFSRASVVGRCDALTMHVFLSIAFSNFLRSGNMVTWVHPASCYMHNNVIYSEAPQVSNSTCEQLAQFMQPSLVDWDVPHFYSKEMSSLKYIWVTLSFVFKVEQVNFTLQSAPCRRPRGQWQAWRC